MHKVRTQTPSPLEPDPDDLAAIARLLAEAERPVLVYGSDVWMDRAEEAARDFAETWRLPVIPNGQGRGVLPSGHELLVTRARGQAFAQADLVIVVGTPLDFRLGYGWFGGKDGAPLARVVHIVDAPSQLATHMQPAASAAGDLSVVFWSLGTACGDAGSSRTRTPRGCPSCPTRRPRPSRATPSSWPRTPTRSTPCASTASWARCWPRTPW